MASLTATVSSANNGSWQGKKPYRPAVVDPKRERTISRLALIKAAATFAAARTDIKSADVVKIAALWERWIAEA